MRTPLPEVCSEIIRNVCVPRGAGNNLKFVNERKVRSDTLPKKTGGKPSGCLIQKLNVILLSVFDGVESVRLFEKRVGRLRTITGPNHFDPIGAVREAPVENMVLPERRREKNKRTVGCRQLRK